MALLIYVLVKVCTCSIYVWCCNTHICFLDNLEAEFRFEPVSLVTQYHLTIIVSVTSGPELQLPTHG